VPDYTIRKAFDEASSTLWGAADSEYFQEKRALPYYIRFPFPGELEELAGKTFAADEASPQALTARILLKGHEADARVFVYRHNANIRVRFPMEATGEKKYRAVGFSGKSGDLEEYEVIAQVREALGVNPAMAVPRGKGTKCAICGHVFKFMELAVVDGEGKEYCYGVGTPAKCAEDIDWGVYAVCFADGPDDDDARTPEETAREKEIVDFLAEKGILQTFLEYIHQQATKAKERL
jgi:hypothetical protein